MAALHPGINFTNYKSHLLRGNGLYRFSTILVLYEFLGALYVTDVQFVDAEWSFGVIFINLFKELCVCCVSADTKHCVSLTFKCLHEYCHSDNIYYDTSWKQDSAIQDPSFL